MILFFPSYSRINYPFCSKSAPLLYCIGLRLLGENYFRQPLLVSFSHRLRQAATRGLTSRLDQRHSVGVSLGHRTMWLQWRRAMLCGLSWLMVELACSNRFPTFFLKFIALDLGYERQSRSRVFALWIIFHASRAEGLRFANDLQKIYKNDSKWWL